MAKLLPCAHCGEPLAERQDGLKDVSVKGSPCAAPTHFRFRIRCAHCGISTDWCALADIAEIRWNARSLPRKLARQRS